MKIIVELQTQVINDLKNLLYFKTKQMNKYSYILALKSNYYQYH